MTPERGGPLDQGSEGALVSLLRSGDEAAFERLVRDHGGRLLSVARRFLRDEEEARDAVQDCFLSAYRALDRFDQGSRLSTWLHRIVINA
jgi:RNA polymerase sigma-70 factor (ECF subfamily)